MKRVAAVLMCVGLLGCKPAATSTTAPTTEPGTTDPTTGEPTTAPASGDPPADGEKPPDGPDPNKVCDAEVQDPKSLFADNVLIRLPKGVDVVEQTPFFARITSVNTMSTCDAIVSYAAVGYFDSPDPKKALTAIRDETIANARQVQASDVKWADEATKNRDYAASYEIPEGPKGEPPIKGWLVLKERQGIMFWAAFETHPNAWNAVKKSFEEAGKRLLITKK